MLVPMQLSFIFANILLWLHHQIQSSFCFTCVEAFRSSSFRPLVHQLRDIAVDGIPVFETDHSDPLCTDTVTFEQLLTVENFETHPITVAVVIDFENVRGYNGFLHSHDTMLSLIGEWGFTEQPSCRVLSNRELFLAVDHGSTPTSFWIPYNATRSCNDADDSFNHGYAVTFSGCNCKADDTIVHDLLPYIFSSFTSPSISHQCTQTCVVQIVTADRLLIQRCHRFLRDYERQSGSKPRSMKKGMLSATVDVDVAKNRNVIELEIISPKLFLSQLEKFHRVIENNDGNANDEDIEKNLSKEILFSKKSIIDSKKKNYGKKTKPAYRKETTEDRIVLAEALRIKLDHCAQSGSRFSIMQEKNYALDGKVLSLSKAYVFQMAEKFLASQGNIVPLVLGQKCPSPLRLVVISDTHGFESQLQVPLPDGDVLLHLGDFAKDTVIVNKMSNRKKVVKSHHSRHDGSQLASFDAWIARQPHPLKIVLRGNHDPKSMTFSQSGATYITQPTSIDIAGFKFSFVPYQSTSKRGLRHKTLLPKAGCDVIASHVPPYSILDSCYTGKSAGSKTLLKSVQQMNGNEGPPILWLCGHIHESRGVVQDVVLCMKTRKTSNNGMTIVNTACANSGHARNLEYGPALLELSNGKRVKVLEMDGQYEFLNARHPYFFQRQMEQNTRSLLLAVDLGLRTGVSLFDAFTGKLLRFEHFEYESIDALEYGAKDILHTWEDDLNCQAITDDISTSKERAAGNLYRVSHVAIEGTDPPLLDAWNRAIGSKIDLMRIKVLLVTPDEWRTDLLRSIDRQSGESAKKASQRIAQLIIKEHSEITMHITGRSSASTQKLHINCSDGRLVQDPPTLGVALKVTPTADVAESILLGYHVCRRLGCSYADTELLDEENDFPESMVHKNPT